MENDESHVQTQNHTDPCGVQILGLQQLFSGYVRICVFIYCAEFQAAPWYVQGAQYASELGCKHQFSSTLCL